MTRSIVILYAHTYILFLFYVMVGQIWSQEETQKGLRKTKVYNKLCPKKQEACHTKQSHVGKQQGRSGGRRGRSERKVKDRTFIEGAKKDKIGQSKQLKIS